MDDPFERDPPVARRAYEAAWPAFLEYNGGDLKVRVRNELVARLGGECDVVFRVAPTNATSDEVMLTPGLRKAIQQLLRTGGRVVPEAAAGQPVPGDG